MRLRALPSPLRGGVGGGGKSYRVTFVMLSPGREAGRYPRGFTPPLTPPRQGEGDPVEQALRSALH